MRNSTGLLLVAVGGILLLAVNLRTPFLSLRITGLVLLGTGLAGLGIPQRGWRWARGHAGQLRLMLDQVAADPEPERERVPLDALLADTPLASTADTPLAGGGSTRWAAGTGRTRTLTP